MAAHYYYYMVYNEENSNAILIQPKFSVPNSMFNKPD